MNVRFTPKSGYWNSIVECPLCAKSGREQVQQNVTLQYRRDGPSRMKIVNGSITRSNPIATFGNLFAPSGESIGESTVPGRTFFECKNGAPAIVVNDRNIKPRPVFEQLHVTLHIGVDSR